MPKRKFDDPKPCPNCESRYTYIDNEFCWVRCSQCYMAGPQGLSEEKAVELWNSLPRRGKYQYCEKCGEKLNPEYLHYCMDEADVEVTPHPKCDRCECEILPGVVHYCLCDSDL